MTECEQWLMNFSRNSELHGALLMGRLARTLSDTGLLVEMTAHCATEARHAAMLSRTIFREYDIRGVTGKDLTAEVARAVARGYAAFLEEKGVRGEIVVGSRHPFLRSLRQPSGASAARRRCLARESWLLDVPASMPSRPPISSSV